MGPATHVHIVRCLNCDNWYECAPHPDWLTLESVSPAAVEPIQCGTKADSSSSLQRPPPRPKAPAIRPASPVPWSWKLESEGPEKLYQTRWAKCVIDLLPHTGEMAKACISQHIGYLGIKELRNPNKTPKDDEPKEEADDLVADEEDEENTTDETKRVVNTKKVKPQLKDQSTSTGSQDPQIPTNLAEMLAAAKANMGASSES